jgi:hypothetical protein
MEKQDILSQLLNGVDEDEEIINLENDTIEEDITDETEDVIEDEIEDSDVDEIEEEEENNNIENEDDSEEKSEVKEEKTKEKEVKLTWIKPLNEIKDKLTVKEFGLQEYIYREQKDPDGKHTGYYECFCRDKKVTDENKNPVWVPMKGLLSNRYIVASVENLAKELEKEVKFKGNPVKHHEPFYLNYSTKTEQDLEVFDDDASKMVFQLVTGIEDEEINDLKSIIQIMISNTYNGTKSIQVNFNIRTNAKIKDNEYNFVDFFTLGRQNYNLAHLNNGLGEVKTKMKSIEDMMKSSKTTLINYKSNIDDIINNIASRFKKVNKQNFLTTVDNLSNDDKNLFYVLLVASIVLSRNFSPKEHSTISSYIDRLYNSSVFAKTK